MNNMKSKDQTLNLRKLSLSVGQFIRYWGFRRIHGAIWTQVYLSNTPLSCTDLATRLALSKSLVSPALEELCKFKLIQEAPAPNEKTKVYVAIDNISDVIQHILKTREAKILDQISKDFSNLSDSAENSKMLNEQKVKDLGEMILAANFMLTILVAQKDILKTPLDFGS
ncbi:MAG: hypothetical protein H7256_13635 [Bdellovibrio sp.]|nr:hypothetical protein [Bdellovibrio sp.]